MTEHLTAYLASVKALHTAEKLARDAIRAYETRITLGLAAYNRLTLAERTGVRAEPAFASRVDVPLVAMGVSTA